jgi:protein gp37
MSKIEWTEKTWNPVTGCSAVSPGCRRCYAARMTRRLAAMPQTREKYAGLTAADGHFNNRILLHDDVLGDPLKWKRPTTVFVCSMSDLFHPLVPWDFVNKVWSVMLACPQHTFQVLTKRPALMGQFFKDKRHPWPAGDGPIYAAPHIWIGTSCENQETADLRVPQLLAAQGRIKFLSCEPLLAPIDLTRRWLSYLSWVIVGGESGPGSQTVNPDWVRSIRDQCAAAGVSFFFKQWGGPNKRAAGRELDGRTYDAMPRQQPTTDPTNDPTGETP